MQYEANDSPIPSKMAPTKPCIVALVPDGVTLSP